MPNNMPNMPNTKNKMGDKELLADAMMSQTYMCDHYGKAADLSTTPNLKDEFLELLKDDENLLYELFLETQKRGWLPVLMADPAQIGAVNQQHQAARTPA